MHCNVICGLSDVIIKTFSQSVVHLSSSELANKFRTRCCFVRHRVPCPDETVVTATAPSESDRKTAHRHAITFTRKETNDYHIHTVNWVYHGKCVELSGEH